MIEALFILVRCRKCDFTFYAQIEEQKSLAFHCPECLAGPEDVIYIPNQEDLPG